MNNRAIYPVLALLVMCSLLLVNSQYQARQLFMELERTRMRQRENEIEWAQLQLNQSLLAKHARIDSMAKSTLHMQPPAAGRTQYLTAAAP